MSDAPPAPRGFVLGYRPGLDGVRAIAVAAVMGYHLRLGWLSGGFLGVDVFFVLSGFLITSLLVAELERREHLDLLAFWARRARRLLPALFVVVAAVVVYARWYASPLALDGIRSDGVATLAYLNNWHQAVTTSYFEQFDALASPLRHTWSLAIEEQFYLVWPLVVAGLWHVARRRALDPRRLVQRVALVGAIASALEMAVMYANGHDRSRVYFGTDTRAQAVLIGAVLALAASRRGLPRFVGTGRNVVLGAATVTLVALLVGANDSASWLYSGGFALAAVAAAVVIAAAAQPDTVLARVLSVRPFVAVGRVSYGLYLWHWPVYVALGRTSLTGAALFLARIGVTGVAAALSYVLVERPIRQWRRSPGSRRRVFALGGTAVALSVALGSVLYAVTASPSIPGIGTSLAGATPAGPVPTPRIVLAGDSTMLTLALYGDLPRRAHIDGRVWAPLGCGFLPAQLVAGAPPKPECATWPQQWDWLVTHFDPSLFVVEFGLWDLADHVVDGVHLRPGDAAFTRAFTAELDRALAIASRRHAGLVLLDAPCLPHVDTSRRVAFNRMLHDFAAAHPDRVEVLEWSALLCGQPSLRADGVHFDSTSAPKVSAWLAPEVRAAALRAR